MTDTNDQPAGADNKPAQAPSPAASMLALILYQEGAQNSGNRLTPEERRKNWIASRPEYLKLARRLLFKMRKQGIVVRVTPKPGGKQR